MWQPLSGWNLKLVKFMFMMSIPAPRYNPTAEEKAGVFASTSG